MGLQPLLGRPERAAAWRRAIVWVAGKTSGAACGWFANLAQQHGGSPT